jgi:hypothetical protein
VKGLEFSDTAGSAGGAALYPTDLISLGGRNGTDRVILSQ